MITVFAAIAVALTVWNYYMDWRWKQRVNERITAIERELNNLK
jgi:hypothetical protein